MRHSKFRICSGIENLPFICAIRIYVQSLRLLKESSRMQTNVCLPNFRSNTQTSKLSGLRASPESNLTPDVGDSVKSVTVLRYRLTIGHQHVKSRTETCHQHMLSPTSVTNTFALTRIQIRKFQLVMFSCRLSDLDFS